MLRVKEKLQQWQQTMSDPRYLLQEFKRTAGPRPLGDALGTGGSPDFKFGEGILAADTSR